MHFASAKTPTLTPLGQRLLALSRAKLHALDAPVGARDPTDGLRRGVLVREAVRNAWASLDSNHAVNSELTTWRAPTSDLGTLTEEDEELDDVVAEERWLDNVLADVDDEPQTWAESTVGSPVYDDYDVDEIESYTFSATPVAMSLDDATDVTIVAVSEYDDDEDIMVEDWLEVNNHHYHVHDQAAFAEDLEVAAEPVHEAMQVEAVPHLDVDSAFNLEPTALAATLVASESGLSPPSSPESERVVTPPTTPDVDLAYALASLSFYALPSADLMPKLESRDTCDKLSLQVIPRREVEAYSVRTPPPPPRPQLSRRASCLFSEGDCDDDDENDHCPCDALGLVCDGDCVPPALSPDEEDEEVDECRTPPFAPIECEEFEECAGGLVDWHPTRFKQSQQKERERDVDDWDVNALRLEV